MDTRKPRQPQIDTSRITASGRKHKTKANESREIEIVQKISKTSGKPASFWYKKSFYTTERGSALRESYAQEIFRLLDAAQPKTRTIVDRYDDIFVFSQEVSGFTSMHTNLKHNRQPTYIKLKDGSMNNLGSITGSSLLAHELDLMTHNVGANNNNTTVKLDGGWCFGRLFMRELHETDPTWNYVPVNPTCKITTTVLEALPALDAREVYAYNFGHQISKGLPYKSTQLFSHLNVERFKLELHQNLLKQILTPNRYFKALSEHLVTGYADKHILHTAYVEIANRRLQILASALEMTSFREYLLTDDAEMVMKQHDNYLHGDQDSFKMSGKTPIFHQCERANFKYDFENLRCLSHLQRDDKAWCNGIEAYLLAQLAEIPTNEFAESPLHFAAMNNNIVAARLILEFAESSIINAKSNDGNTPFMLAIRDENIDIADMLAENPFFDVSVKNSKNQNALQLAFENQYYPVCMRIIDHYPEGHRFEEIGEWGVEVLLDYAKMYHYDKAITRLESVMATYQNAASPSH